MIDGIRLSQCEFFRYRHNDYEHLKNLLEKNAGKFDRTFKQTKGEHHVHLFLFHD